MVRAAVGVGDEALAPLGAWGAPAPSRPQIVQMSNYCGIGIDAELSLDFHQAREEEPGKFTSRCRERVREQGLPPVACISWGPAG